MGRADREFNRLDQAFLEPASKVADGLVLMSMVLLIAGSAIDNLALETRAVLLGIVGVSIQIGVFVVACILSIIIDCYWKD